MGVYLNSEAACTLYKYALRFQAKPGGRTEYTGRILAVGIGYEKEQKKHSCKVEVLKRAAAPDV